ncbi:type I restriction-modification system subunit M [Streptococcus suis]|uniref:site-specific DNA-methyltransferase (adenine-specific) n=1 Tax=Streptococcus suis TaxID=1307 RepID=A0A0Z8J9X4_STRSU|nr:class I SAM-dependent DNA methyltransferase [Streptococcus suis]MDY7602725.1 class I SAM-dependent DNA methyltransferase [Streptococcus suis]NQG70969.1 N-6 DNA methylase [Streptococcus suis]NQH61431.1 N-6 DNA methylase [Streptococcus suis]NQN45531.1 N-6 DNA methylase [Streptococcus suis]UTI55392.1 type I restriction-modification system subunit M [Streptococcus suis]
MVDIRRKLPLFQANDVNISKDVNLVWSIANTLRGAYRADKYRDVIIPMFVLARLEAALLPTKEKVLAQFQSNPSTPEKIFESLTGYKYYNTSKHTLKNLLNEPDAIKDNFLDYLDGYSKRVKDIIENLKFKEQVDTLASTGRLFTVVKKFSELDLSPSSIDSMRMGYMFEDIIRRFSENEEAGSHYTPREVIALMVNLLLMEADEELFVDNKEIKVLDMAAGTGGMLATAKSYIQQLNPKVNVRLFGQEYLAETYGIGKADMLIRQEESDYFVKTDTLKDPDPFYDKKMNFVIANPPFGQSWGGKDADDGVEQAVKDDQALFESTEGREGRFINTPTTGDAQLLFHLHALAKLEENGRAAIISNGSPLFSGGTTSGESQIRRYILENDLLEAIVALPGQFFYNTGIGIYIWLYNKDKSPERQGKVQFIDATNEFVPLRKSLGQKRRELSQDNIKDILQWYHDFEENDRVKIFDSKEFLYKEYLVMQPLQRRGEITEKSLDSVQSVQFFTKLFDEYKYQELLEMEPRTAKQDKELQKLEEGRKKQEEILQALRQGLSEATYPNFETFTAILKALLSEVKLTPANLNALALAMSEMDKTAEVITTKKKDKLGEIADGIVYDKTTKDSEIVKLSEEVEAYFEREVYSHVPDAHYWWEENKLGAEIPFTRYFYQYQAPEKAEDLLKQFYDLEDQLQALLEELKHD